MYDVITFGSATIDIFADTFDRKHLTNKQKDMRYNHVISYDVGKKILIRDLQLSVGGGGTNTAVTFARFGLNTAFCGGLGSDSSADLVRTYLQNEHIAFVGCETNDKTGLSIVLDSIEHDRTILAYKGANNMLTCMDKTQFEGVTLFYFSSLLEKSFETHKAMVTFAIKNGIKIAFNPSSYQAIQGHKKLAAVLKHTNYLILNKEEAQDLTGSHSANVKDLLQLLHSYISSDGIVVITDGKFGAYAYTGEDTFHVKPNNITVVESTGAGDAFASGYIAAMLKGHSVKEALAFGAANSESVITYAGAKEKILTYDQAKSKMRKVSVVNI